MKSVMLIRSAFLAAIVVALVSQDEVIVYRPLLDDLAPVEASHAPPSAGLLQFLSGLVSSPEKNERCASTSLKSLSVADADFRPDDRDWNHVNDFWTGVPGLYHLTSAEVAAPSDAAITLIELSVAAGEQEDP